MKGKSTGNQRIEREWGSVGPAITQKWARTFLWLEKIHHLDRSNNLDIWILHKAYKQHIQISIDTYVSAHNHHPSQAPGERGNSPCKSWIAGQ